MIENDNTSTKQIFGFSSEIHEICNLFTVTCQWEVELLQNRIQKKEEIKPEDFNKLKDGIRLTSQRLRLLLYESISVIEQKSFFEEIEFIKGYSTSEFVINISDDIKLESYPQIAQELSLIGREAVVNAIRHSNAKHISIKLNRVDNELILEIMDDGIGFSMEKMHEGYGFSSMHKTMELIQGKLEIDSQEGHGTRIVAKIPIMKN